MILNNYHDIYLYHDLSIMIYNAYHEMDVEVDLMEVNQTTAIGFS